MAITGDFSKFSQWIESLEELAKDEFRREYTGDMAMITRQLIDDGFTTEKDPDGRAWEPKKRPNGFKILEGETKDLRHNFKIKEVTSSGFKIKNDTPYFRPHQDGARGRGRRSGWRLPQRKMMPEGEFPPGYTKLYTEAYNRKILSVLKKSR